MPSNNIRVHSRSHTKQTRVCQWNGCSREFSSTSLLKYFQTSNMISCPMLIIISKHLDSHAKPYTCTETMCMHRSATLRDLRRHVLTHRLPPGTNLYYCPIEVCKHSEHGTASPFKRVDFFKRHMKRKHPNLSAAPIINKSSLDNTDNQLVNHSVS